MPNETGSFIRADWPLANVHAGTTTRIGGVSQPPYDGFNLASHVGDEAARVEQNRQQLSKILGLPSQPCWLEQVHGNVVANAAEAHGIPCADASYSIQKAVVCAVLTADCLPVLFASRDGQAVAAAHAGWRGLAAGVLEATVEALVSNGDCHRDDVFAWMGPAIGPEAFEVGRDVLDAFTAIDPVLEEAFSPGRAGHWQADIYALGRGLLQRCGLSNIFGGGYCTYADEERFYSFRRSAETGRMASLIWMP